MQNKAPFLFFLSTFAKRNIHQSFPAIPDLYFPMSLQGPVSPPRPAQQQAPVCIPVWEEFCRAGVQPDLLPDPGTVPLCQSRCLPQGGDERVWHSNLMDPEVFYLILRVCAGYVIRNLPSNSEDHKPRWNEVVAYSRQCVSFSASWNPNFIKSRILVW